MSRDSKKTVPCDRLPERLPRTARRERIYTVGFGGLAVTPQAPFESRTILGREPWRIADMENLSPRAYPALAVRRPRELLAVAQNQLTPHGMAVMNGRLYFAQGTTLYRTAADLSAARTGMTVEVIGTLSDTDKHMAVCGDRLCIFPDKKYVSADGTLHDMELDTGDIAGVELMLYTMTLPEGMTWAALGFAAGDGIYLVNRDDATPAPTGNYGIKRVQGRVAYLTTSFSANYTSTVAVRRLLPDLEGVCVSGNRLCGFAGRRIHISAEGNPFSWNAPMEDGAAGATLSVDTEGSFTACAAWQGYAVFFKEHGICRLLGSRSDSFTLSELPAPGLPAALSGTLCEVGGALYYHGDAGVYRYGQAGQLPERVAHMPGGRAVGGLGGSDGLCYYLHLLQESEDGAATTRRSYVFSPEHGAWYAEDTRPMAHMQTFGGFLCLQDADGHLWLARSDGRLLGCSINETALHGSIVGRVTFSPDHTASPEGYRPAALGLRATSGEGGELRVLAAFSDPATGGASAATELAAFPGGGRDRLLRVSFIPRTCDSLIWQLEMQGDWQIDAAVREYENCEREG